MWYAPMNPPPQKDRPTTLPPSVADEEKEEEEEEEAAIRARLRLRPPRSWWHGAGNKRRDAMLRQGAPGQGAACLCEIRCSVIEL